MKNLVWFRQCGKTLIQTKILLELLEKYCKNTKKENKHS